jgi:hypothetical protein
VTLLLGKDGRDAEGQSFGKLGFFVEKRCFIHERKEGRHKQKDIFLSLLIFKIIGHFFESVINL